MLRKTRARKVASGLLEECGVNKVPVDIDRIVDKIVKLLPTTNIQQIKGLSLKVLKEDFPGDLNDVSAILLKEKGQVIIAVNSTHSENRQRFSIAHELGHLILHSNNEQLTVEKQFFTRANGVHSLHETEANEFAAELLMPEILIRKDFNEYFKNDEDLVVSRLAQKYKVSEAAITYRLINLNLLY